jgi:hypothetical protein
LVQEKHFVFPQEGLEFGFDSKPDDEDIIEISAPNDHFFRDFQLVLEIAKGNVGDRGCGSCTHWKTVVLDIILVAELERMVL